MQVVRLAGRLGLVKLEHVAQDGTKMLANASKHRAMSYARMKQAEERLGKEIQALLEAATAADGAEDAEVGPERTGDELPEDVSGEITRRERRLATIREAKAALEREAKAEAEAIRQAEEAERERRAEAGEPKKPGKRPAPSALPKDAAQRNFTAPDSRIMKHSDKAFVQAYNAQVAVDASGHQSIVGCALTNQRADAPHREPLVEQVQETPGDTPKEWSADAGDFSTHTRCWRLRGSRLSSRRIVNGIASGLCQSGWRGYLRGRAWARGRLAWSKGGQPTRQRSRSRCERS